jgi:hypothetical protein
MYTDRARAAHLVARRRRQLTNQALKHSGLEWLGDRLVDRATNQVVVHIQCDPEVHGLWRARSRNGRLSEATDKSTAKEIALAMARDALQARRRRLQREAKLAA